MANRRCGRMAHPPAAALSINIARRERMRSVVASARARVGRFEPQPDHAPRIGLDADDPPARGMARPTRPARGSARRAGRSARRACRPRHRRRPAAHRSSREISSSSSARVGFPQSVVEQMEHAGGLPRHARPRSRRRFPRPHPRSSPGPRCRRIRRPRWRDGRARCRIRASKSSTPIDSGTNKGVRSSAVDRARSRLGSNMRLEHVLDVNHADDFIEAVAGDRQAAMPGLGEGARRGRRS